MRGSTAADWLSKVKLLLREEEGEEEEVRGPLQLLPVAEEVVGEVEEEELLEAGVLEEETLEVAEVEEEEEVVEVVGVVEEEEVGEEQSLAVEAEVLDQEEEEEPTLKVVDRVRVRIMDREMWCGVGVERR